MPQLILGSTSPYKHDLLQEAGYDFIVEDSGLDERSNHLHTVADTVEHLARLKAEAVLAEHEGDDVVVISTDVAGELAGEFLGKPDSLEQAYEMIMSYSGKLVYVWCGTAIGYSATGEVEVDLRRADIQFASLNPAEVQEYVDEMEPIDKGGAIAIEEIEERGFITSITGEQEAIIGISMEFVRDELPLGV